MKPPLACVKCRLRKKKCDRAYPICSSCLRTHDRCEYRVSSSSNKPPIRLPLTQTPDSDQVSRPTGFEGKFLGYPFFPDKFIGDSTSNIPIPSDLQSFVIGDDNLRQHITDFLEETDLFCMPFIPRQDLEVKLLSQIRQLNGAAILLLACIKILGQQVQDDPRSNPQYLVIKTGFVSAEVNGFLTVRLLQALLLLLFYEFSHGIYPSAFITLGTCTRYLAALGINGGSLSFEDTNNWIEAETRRRLWWAVYSMERIMMLGYPKGTLLLKEPDKNENLPSDDVSWDQAYPSPEAYLTLLSPAKSEMSSFRLLVHAAYLIGRVLQHASDDHLPLQAYNEKGAQIYRTICALMTVLDNETRSAIIPVSVPRGVLNSAVFLLYSISACGGDQSNVEYFEPARKSSAAIFLSRARLFFEGNLRDIFKPSPFLTHWGFHVYQYFYAIYRQEGHSESLQVLKDLEKAFEILGKRWKLTEVYVTLLNDMQAS
ncbi:fungal-specific transcription factor domain-containing protein [Talaromyces proteolyticus]|uniref:Fungal-specific transcription factor domain-containing protein n=1 Tax=Talaromyces proteolyticus TaxID=1131652 RepID=A0AAD4PRR6_9EURO|nr:fungal-specific transcription factor domain-containing protein [Talaromyces proteolyticus]KAH8689579.1 fungal-specific transcription factor domain-containing protein [Talaromyces proteolyticus]